MAIQAPVCTVADFEHFLTLREHRGRYFALIHGEIIEKVPTAEHSYLATHCCGFSWQDTRQSGMGHAVIEVRVQIPEDDYNSRQLALMVFALKL